MNMLKKSQEHDYELCNLYVSYIFQEEAQLQVRNLEQLKCMLGIRIMTQCPVKH